MRFVGALFAAFCEEDSVDGVELELLFVGCVFLSLVDSIGCCVAADGVAKGSSDGWMTVEDGCITPRFVDCDIIDTIAGALSDACGVGLLWDATIDDVVVMRAVRIHSTR